MLSVEFSRNEVRTDIPPSDSILVPKYFFGLRDGFFEFVQFRFHSRTASVFDIPDEADLFLPPVPRNEPRAVVSRYGVGIIFRSSGILEIRLGNDDIFVLQSVVVERDVVRYRGRGRFCVSER